MDLVSFDLDGDADTAREVYGLDKTIQDYVDTYCLLKEYVRVVPHLTIGLRGGQISGEFEALQALSGLDVEELVLSALGHRERRRILEVVGSSPEGVLYSDILHELGVNTGKLNYHLKLLEGVIERDEASLEPFKAIFIICLLSTSLNLRCSSTSCTRIN